MKSTVMKCAGLLSVLSCCMGVYAQKPMLPAPQFAPRPIETRLFLSVGEVDTRLLPNALQEQRVRFEAGKAFVLQMDGPMTAERKTALTAAGVQLQQYLPDHAYIVDLSATLPVRLERLPFVRWVGEYQDAWKLDPTIGQRLVPFATPERIQIAADGQLKLVVTLFEGTSVEQGRVALANLGAAIVDGHLIDRQAAIDIIVDADQLQRLAEQPFVQYVEEAPEITYRNNTTRWIIQSNVNGVTPFYDHGIKGLGQIVGVMDGRVKHTHCSFVDPEGDPFGPLHRKIQAYNTSVGADSHGTHVACTAIGDNGLNNDTRGIAYEGRLVYNTVPSFNETSMVNALTTHHNQGARVHTNSWGNDGSVAYDSLCRGIDVFSRNNEEDLVLFAVTNLSSLKNPENAKNLVAVGASQDTPSQQSHCSGGAGPTLDGRRKPEVYAPGCNTLSASSSGTCGTVAFTGTSMASPAVAGLALLMRQYFMDGFYPSGVANPSDALTPSGALVKAMLINASVDMTGVSGYPSNQEGWGRALGDGAAYFAGDTRKLVVKEVRNADGFSTGGMTEYGVGVTGSTEKLKVTLVWTDVAASAGATQTAINDLDLQVVSPSSATYLGNVFTGGVSVTGGTKDAKNNVEQVHISAPETGTWTIRVNAAAVNQGTQGYGLVISGEVSLDPTCDDGILNQGEDLIDCGGPCKACQCLVQAECDDGAFCNGVENCTEIGRCANGTPACVTPPTTLCDETNDLCLECLDDGDCDDNRFCTGVETCDPTGACQDGPDPCTDPEMPFCDDELEVCHQCETTADCDDADACTIDSCGPGTPLLCGYLQLTILYGDVNDNLVIDVDDLDCVLGAFIGESPCPKADLDPCVGDGDVDVDDIVAMLEVFTGSPICPDPCPVK